MHRLMENGGQGGDLVNNSFMCYFYYYLLWPRNRKWFLMSPSLPDDGPSPFGYLQDGESWTSGLDAFTTHRMQNFFYFHLFLEYFRHIPEWLCLSGRWCQLKPRWLLLFYSKDGATLKKRRRGWFKRPLDARANSIVFPQTHHHEVGVLSTTCHWETKACKKLSLCHQSTYFLKTFYFTLLYLLYHLYTLISFFSDFNGCDCYIFKVFKTFNICNQEKKNKPFHILTTSTHTFTPL